MSGKHCTAKADKRKNIAYLLQVIRISVACIGVIALLLLLATGQLTLGVFISLATAFFSMIDVVAKKLLNQASDLNKNLGYITDTMMLERMQEDPAWVQQPAGADENVFDVGFENIVFHGVKLAYPGQSSLLLDGLELELHRGRHYALVGATE